MYFFPGFSFSWGWGRYKWGKSSLGPKCSRLDILRRRNAQVCTVLSYFCWLSMQWKNFERIVWSFLYVFLWRDKLGAIIVCIGACCPFVAAKGLVSSAWFLIGSLIHCSVVIVDHQVESTQVLLTQWLAVESSILESRLPQSHCWFFCVVQGPVVQTWLRWLNTVSARSAVLCKSPHGL